MIKKRQPFIIDNDLGPALKTLLPGDARTTVQCGLPPHAPDYPDVVDLCFREQAILVTADTDFPAHIRRYQKEHNDCCRGLLLVPSEELKQGEVLKRLKNKKIILKHPVDDQFSFETARWDHLLINLRANPPQVTGLCNCKWQED